MIKLCSENTLPVATELNRRGRLRELETLQAISKSDRFGSVPSRAVDHFEITDRMATTLFCPQATIYRC